MVVSGILNVCKPSGWTSMDVVRLVKRLSHHRHVGHGGTLDPQATGVLPIFFGQATRVMEHLINGTKIYHACIVMGASTDTYDDQGSVTHRGDPSEVTQEQMQSALSSFRGVIHQVPPMYSALKREGRRLYDIARAGEEVPREARRVFVSRLELLEWDPPTLAVAIECGRGVYIRSLAHDLGQALGCGGHLGTLTRLRAGPFELSAALSIEQLREAFRDGGWQESLYPLDAVVLHLRAAVAGPIAEGYLRNGRPVAFPTRRRPPLQQETCRVYTQDGHFLALVHYQHNRSQWQPDKVFQREEEQPQLRA